MPGATFSDLVTVGIFVAGSIMGSVKWWSVRQDKRITSLESRLAEQQRDIDQKVGFDVYNATLEALRKDIRESSNQSMQFLRDATKQITDATDRVNARIDNFLTKDSK